MHPHPSQCATKLRIHTTKQTHKSNVTNDDEGYPTFLKHNTKTTFIIRVTFLDKNLTCERGAFCNTS